MRYSGYPLVPMLVHHIVIELASGLIQIGINILDRLTELHGRNHDHALLIGREHESLDTLLEVAHAAASAAVGIHGPELRHLSLAILGVDKGNLLTSIDPHIVTLTARSVGDLAGVLAIDVHHPQVAVTLVGGDIIMGDAVKDLLAVGRHLRTTHTTQQIKEFGSKLFLLHLGSGFFGGRSLTRSRFLLGAGRRGQQSQDCNRHCCNSC